MQNKSHSILFIVLVLALLGCETPGSPDFTLSSSVDTPIIADASFIFFGGRNAIIDTTSNEDLADLFSVDGDNFLTLSVDEEFDIRDLDDVIPVIDVEPSPFDAAVGEIQLDDFSSQDDDTGNLGEASFEELTGIPSDLEEGDTIPGSTSPFPVNIEPETDYFVSATIKRGGINVSIRNELGFNIDEVTIELFSGNNFIGTVVMNDLNHLTTQSSTLPVVDNPDTDPEVQLTNINTDISISWSEQTMQDVAGSLIINHLEGEELFASQIEAVVPEQDFFSSGVTDFSDEDIQLTQPDHYVELETAVLTIQNIINQIDVDIEMLQLSFPGIRQAPYSAADSLVIVLEGEDRIERNNITPVLKSIELSDVRLYATGNEVEYNIFGLTENTQQNGAEDARVINESDMLSAEVVLTNLMIKEAFGILTNKQIILNDSEPGSLDGVDIKNNFEAEIIEIDGLSDLSGKVDGITFTNSSLSIDYFTNIDASATIIGAFLGIDANGNEFYLRGLPGSDFQLSPNDPTNDLLVNGSPIPISDLIKFDIETDGDFTTGKSVTFDSEQTNISEFLSALPVEIRFVGLANINETGQEEGRVTTPVRFDPSVGVNIPMSIVTIERAAYTDTTSADLSDLPDEDDDFEIKEGILTLNYENALPFMVDLQLGFLDEADNLITYVPLPAEDPFEIRAGTVGASGFISNSHTGTKHINLSSEQLSQLHRSRNVKLMAGLETIDRDEVRVRSSDHVSFQITGKFTIQRRIN